MKKIITAALLILLLSAICVLAEDVPEVTFEPVGGGKFIYCNNQEALLNTNLMNGEEPMYLMNNEGLEPDRYVLYISHINYTGPGYGTGFDVELDVELTAREDSVIILNKAAFETPEMYGYTVGGVWYPYEGEWGLFKVCCDMLDVPLHFLDGTVSHTPREFEPVTLEIKAGETVFLSEYLADYEVVHYGRPVHIQADLQLVSGKMDINIGALKHNGTLKDRSEWDFDAAFGKYFRDRCSKGIADTLPETVARLDYVLTDETADMSKLPVLIKNQYHPEGTVLDYWVTNINPQNDVWTKYSAAESCMVPLYYKDPTKLEYYGSKVPEEEKDDVWVFDVFHSDTNKHAAAYGPVDTYKPNFVLDVTKDNLESSCCLGNYGIATTYEITVENQSAVPRYVGLDVNTASAIIAYTTDEQGNRSDAVVKNWAEYKETVTMCEAEILPGETKKLRWSVILPVNYNGGTMNELVVSNSPRFVQMPLQKREKTDILKGVLLSKSPMAESELDIFEGNRNSYSYLEGKEDALVRWCAWDGKPAYYYNIWKRCNKVYLFDKEGKLKAEKEFESFPCRDSWDGDSYYVQLADGSVWKMTEEYEWERFGGALPEYIPYYDLENASEWAKFWLELGYADNIRLNRFDDGYRFGEKITRRDFCILAGQYIKAEEPEKTVTFTDTDEPEVLRLAAMGIILGFEDGTFRPDEAITREQAAVILERILRLELDEETEEYVYNDDEFISDWAKNAASLMKSAGIMIGGYDNTFMPLENYTREQAVVTIMRMKDFAEKRAKEEKNGQAENFEEEAAE